MYPLGTIPFDPTPPSPPRPYMAPELLDIVVNNRTEYSFYAGALYDEKVDIWALGVTIYQLLYGQMPFRGKNEADILEAIREDGEAPRAARQDLL